MAILHPTTSIECWKPIPGLDGYDASNFGRIRSWHRSGRYGGKLDVPRIRVLPSNRNGYLFLMVVKDGHKVPQMVHRLILEAFVGPRPPDQQCRHLDGDKKNNRLDNLVWGTRTENSQDKIRHGTVNPYVPKQYKPFMFFDSFIPVAALVPAETWVPIQGCDGYEISSFGCVRSYRTKHGQIGNEFHSVWPGGRHRSGHLSIRLRSNRGRQFTYSVHRLVLEAFSPCPSSSLLLCRHLDGDAANNHIANLRWSTHLENQRDKFLHGTMPIGENHHTATMSDAQIAEIRRRYDAGEPICKIAKSINQKYWTVGRICRRQSRIYS